MHNLKNNHPKIVKPILLDFGKYDYQIKIVKPIVPVLFSRALN
jgi:hypothetical protein